MPATLIVGARLSGAPLLDVGATEGKIAEVSHHWHRTLGERIVAMRIPALIVALLLATAPGSGAAQEVPDFSGSWRLDTERSAGPIHTPPPVRSQPFRVGRVEPGRTGRAVPECVGRVEPGCVGRAGGVAATNSAAPGPEEPVAIEQTLRIRQDRKTLRIAQITNDRQEEFRLRLDGAQTKNHYYLSGSRVEIPTVTRWSGRELITSGSTMTGTTQGRVPIVFYETRSLSADGSELVIETQVQSPLARFERRLVYLREGD